MTDVNDRMDRDGARCRATADSRSAPEFEHESSAWISSRICSRTPRRSAPWSNFEFRDNRGRWHEVDLLVLSRDTL